MQHACSGGGESPPAAGYVALTMASGKTITFCVTRLSKRTGPGKTLCDTEEMSYESQLSFIESEIGRISAGAKAIIAF